jgi:hypothetical protein
MPDYRIYNLSGDGHIREAPILIIFENDQEAIEAVRRMLDGNDIGVWQGARRISRLKSIHPYSAASV